MKYNISRFIKAQQIDFSNAFLEIQNGRKESHWIWYIFPQIKGIGYSTTSKYYAISCLEEAKEYMANEYLANNLIKISQALLDLKSNDAYEIMGDPDDKKLRSSMTLFYLATSNPIFLDVLKKFYNGKLDRKTINIINNEVK